MAFCCIRILAARNRTRMTIAVAWNVRWPGITSLVYIGSYIRRQLHGPASEYAAFLPFPTPSVTLRLWICFSAYRSPAASTFHVLPSFRFPMPARNFSFLAPFPLFTNRKRRNYFFSYQSTEYAGPSFLLKVPSIFVVAESICCESLYVGISFFYFFIVSCLNFDFPIRKSGRFERGENSYIFF